MTTTTKKGTPKRIGKNRDHLPPSADIISISGRKYLIAPLDEFQEWDEDRLLLRLVTERIEEGGPYIALEEFEKRLEQRNKGKK